MINCCPSGNSVGRQKFFYFCAEMLRQAPHALCPNPPIPPYGASAEIWAVGFLFCGEQPLNILEVVGLRAPTPVAECHRHSAKSRLSLRMERALRSGRWDSIRCGEQPLNILEVVGLRAPTAVAECHRHSAKSRPSLRMERAPRSGRWDSICCGKQPLNILEVVGLRAPTAVETCHWHVSKSRLSNPTFGAKNNSHPNGWLLFWRRRWDSNPRGVLPPTRFRVELVMTTSILLRIAPVLQALIYSIMQ